jgi:cobalt-zinc-cadmium efflux system membrane fusion protein
MKVRMIHASALAALGAALWGCGGSPSSASPAEQAAAAAPAAGRATYFSVPQDQLAHVQVVPVQRATWTTTLRTTGTVDWDNDHTTQAITQVSGPITRLLVDAGTHVTAGQPLLYVSSPDVTSAISAYRKAKNRQDLAQRTLNRDTDLLAHKAISQHDLEQTQADFNDAATDVQAALQALRILDVTPSDLQQAEAQNVPIRPELPMRATLTGTIVQKMVLPGQVIQAGSTVAFVITNVDTVWVQAHVYEKDLGKVHLHDQADVRAASFPEAFPGTVTYIGDMIDAATRTTPVRIVTRNPRALLKKDMFVDVVVSDRTSRDVLTIPTAAVLYDDENFPFVYLQVEPGKFGQRLVNVGTQQGDQVEVVSGLNAGDRVVSQGSLFLQFANSSQK